MIFRKQKTKLVILGLVGVFVVSAAGFLTPKISEAQDARKEFYPDKIGFETGASVGLIKATRAEIDSKKSEPIGIDFTLKELVDTSGNPAPELRFDANDDQIEDIVWTSTAPGTDTTWAGKVEALVIDVGNVQSQCGFTLPTLGRYAQCSTLHGNSPNNSSYYDGDAGLIPIFNPTAAARAWKVGEKKSVTLNFTAADLPSVTNYLSDCKADSAKCEKMKEFSMRIVPNFLMTCSFNLVHSYNCAYATLTGGSNAIDGQPLTVKVRVYESDEAKAEDKTETGPIKGGSSGNTDGGTLASLGEVINEAITWLILANTRIIYWIFASVLAPLIEALLKVHPYQDVFVEAIYLGWQLIRNLCNIFFIVILLVIGLGTLFRVESYSYKHLLVKVVIAALLVNFSLVFGQAILGIADTVQQQFLPDSSNVVRALGSKLMVEPINLLTQSAGTDTTVSAGASFGNIAKPIFAFALALGAFFAFVALAAFLVIRIVALWILLLVSPIAYVANILPSTAHYGKDWWQKFLKYAFMTPVLAFFLNLAAVFATSVIKDQAAFSKLLQTENVDGDITQFVYIAGSQILVILFILVGLKAAASTGTYGAAAVTNFAEKGLRKPLEWAGRAGKGVAGTAGGLAKAGAERGFDAAQNAVGITVDPRLLKKAWTDYSTEQKGKRLQARATRSFLGIDGAPKFGDARSNFEAYANWRGVKRATVDSKLGFRGAGYNSIKAREAETRASLLTDEEVKAKELERRQLLNESITGKGSVATLQQEIEQMEKKLPHPDDPRFKNADGTTKNEVLNLQKRIDEKKNDLAAAETKQVASEEKLANIITELKKDKKIKEDGGIKDWRNDWKKEDKDKAKTEAKHYEERIAITKRPEGYAAIASHHHLLSEEKKKIEHIDEYDRLIQLYKDAVVQKDRYKAEAVMQKLAKDVNFNEILESLYGKNDYETFVAHFTGKDSHGKVAKDEDGKEINSFAKVFGLSQHEALESMSEASYINEDVNMWNLTRAIEVDKHGHMKALTQEDHDKIIEIQMKKSGSERQAREFWRGAYVDEDITKGEKIFRLHNAGIKIINDSLSKGAGLRSIAERMQEYNRAAIAKAIRDEVATGKARASIKALADNDALMKALEKATYKKAETT